MGEEKMEDKLLNVLYGRELVYAMAELLEKFMDNNCSVDKIVKEMAKINESVRVGIYLMAVEKNYSDLAIKINKANKIINDKRKEDFIKAFNNNEVTKFLVLLGKGDKISLMNDLGVDVNVRERAKLTDLQRKYYDVIKESIITSQREDKRNGVVG